MKVDAAGFALNPTVRSVIVQSVLPKSPAAEQHSQVGDEVIEAEGKIVSGGPALQLRAILSKQVATFCTYA